MAESSIKNYIYANTSLQEIQLSGGYSGVNVSLQLGCKYGLIKIINIDCSLGTLAIPINTIIFKLPSGFAAIKNQTVIHAYDDNGKKIYHFRVDIAGNVWTTEQIPNTVDLRIIDIYV